MTHVSHGEGLLRLFTVRRWANRRVCRRVRGRSKIRISPGRQLSFLGEVEDGSVLTTDETFEIDSHPRHLPPGPNYRVYEFLCHPLRVGQDPAQVIARRVWSPDL